MSARFEVRVGNQVITSHGRDSATPDEVKFRADLERELRVNPAHARAVEKQLCDSITLRGYVGLSGDCHAPVLESMLAIVREVGSAAITARTNADNRQFKEEARP